MDATLGLDNRHDGDEELLEDSSTPSQVLPVRLSTGEFEVRRDEQGRIFVVESDPLPPSFERQSEHALANLAFEDLEFLRPVGSGGIAEIWLARNAACREPFVVKVARTEYAENPHVHAQFAREWTATRRLQHNSILDHHSRGLTADGRPFLTMDLVRGYPLSRFVDNAVTWRFLRAALVQTCDVLAYIHEHDVLHQDLKPSNILVDLRHRRILLTDFGLARFQQASTGSTAKTVLGTPSYMAPEQARGQLDWLGPHTDLYTVGVMLYELLSGAKPFNAESDRLVMIQHCTLSPPPLVIRDGIDAPEAIRGVLDTLLAKSPSARFVNANQLKEALLALG